MSDGSRTPAQYAGRGPRHCRSRAQSSAWLKARPDKMQLAAMAVAKYDSPAPHLPAVTLLSVAATNQMAYADSRVA